MRISSILLALLVASAFAYVGLSLTDDLSTTYSVTIEDNTSVRYETIQDESENVADDINQVHDWLQDLTEGDIGGFVFAMPANVANILGIFLQIPNLAYSIVHSTLAVFGIPAFIFDIIAVMLIVSVVLIIVGIWTEGKV